jgi:hypothetical protein
MIPQEVESLSEPKRKDFGDIQMTKAIEIGPRPPVSDVSKYIL